MFDRTERAFFTGNDPAPIVSSIGRALHEEELPIEQVAPAVWTGKSSRSAWWMSPRVRMNAFPTPRGYALEVRVSADIEPSGAVLMVLCWFCCFPAAIVLGVLAYQEYTRRQATMFDRMLAEVRPRMIEPNFPPAFG